MSFPENLRYTKEHEWVLLEGSKARIGITAFATEELGDIVFVELPKVGQTVESGNSFCVVESTKAASDVYAPISGKVQSVNSELSAEPEKLNSAPYTDGWLVILEEVSEAEVAALMNASQYEEFIGSK